MSLEWINKALDNADWHPRPGRRDRNAPPSPPTPPSAAENWFVPAEWTDELPTEWDISAAQALLAPRSRFGPIFGLTQKDIDRAATRVAIGEAMSPFPRFVKRALDILLSGSALIFLAGLFASIAILIRLDSKGPVFFRQERVGLNGTKFSMIKFRSMVTTAEADLAAILKENEDSGVLFKLRADPRITRIGAVLRRYSLDELPQLWNIFVGDMSIVGPRPPLAREAEQNDDREWRRLLLKPGLTGAWQVGGRSDLSWEESIRLDLHYVDNWSILGDLHIMWRTVGVVIGPVGYY